jgi:quinol monooxygenase YgiN
MNQNDSMYLLAIRGNLAPKTLEAARALHNSTAGHPANVAAAKSLGDLCHMVYVPLQASPDNEFLILDVWNSLEGLNQFFTNPTVQEQAGQIFTRRDPVVWAPAGDFISYHIPSPFGKNERYVAVVRGTATSREDAQARHNALIAKATGKARRRGHLSHDAYFRLSPPGTPESNEFFAVDVWMNAAGMGEHYQDPEIMAGIGPMFAGMPTSSIWVHPAGDWVEW